MRHHGFVEKGVDPADVYSRIKQLIQNEGFKIVSEDTRPGLLGSARQKI